MLKKGWRNWKEEDRLKQVMDIIGLFVIFSGIGVSIFMNTLGRSLWLDEAYLVSSLKNRTLLNLTSTPLDYIQSAPVIYLYIVKILMMLFGESEAVLRLFSIFSYALTIFLSYYASKKVFDCKYPLLCGAFVANIDFLLKYSNVFKPYVSECVWVLLVILIYHWYQEEKLTWWMMAVFYMILIWAANPVCFFIGGVLTCEFLGGIFKKEKKIVFQSVMSGIGICGSFVVYYFYWLRAAATDDFMQKYWINDRFPLFPRNKEDLERGMKMIRRLFATGNEELRFLLLALVVAALIWGIYEKNRCCNAMLIGFLLALFASSLYMFPVRDRLWTFSFPLFAVLAFYFIDQMLIRPDGKRGEIFAVLLMVLLIWTNSGIKTFKNAEAVYWEGNEANPLIQYVEENVKEDEMVYVFYNSIPVVTYKNGYGVNRIGNVTKDNIIWGTSVLAEADKELVAGQEKCYILTSQADGETIGPLLDYLSEQGTLETLLDCYETRLYYYSR